MAAIKALMLPHLTPIARLIAKKKEGYDSLITVLLPVVQRLLVDDVADVSTGAAEVLADIAELLTEEDRRDHILAIVLSTSCCHPKNSLTITKTLLPE